MCTCRSNFFYISQFKDHRGGPGGKPPFDGPPMPVEGMTVRELEAITGN